MRAVKLTSFVIIAVLWASGGTHAEPLRVLVAQFAGQAGPHITTTLYLDALRAFDRGGEKGVYVLYSNRAMTNYESALEFAQRPSVRADVVVWGDVTRVDQDYIVQSYLAVTPVLLERNVRTDIWRLTDKKTGMKVELGLPRTFYEFEPIILSAAMIQRYESPSRVPLYKEPKEPGSTNFLVVGELGEIFEFFETRDDNLHVRLPNGVQGWIRLQDVNPIANQTSSFTKAILKYLRGDWQGASQDFDLILKDTDVPQAVRIDCAIYSGVAKIRLGGEGLYLFEMAFDENQYNRVSAQYVITGLVAKVFAGGSQQEVAALRNLLEKRYEKSKPLFDNNDPWLVNVARILGL